MPRLTTLQMAAIVPAPDGLLVYNTDSSKFYFFDGSISWLCLVPGTDTIGHLCGNPFQDERDWRLYSTILVGTQCWMAENLNIGTRVDIEDSLFSNGIIE